MARAELITGPYHVPVTVFGKGDRCLVCVNAAQQTMGAWAALARRFTRAGYRVVLFDFPNQGRAATPSRSLRLIEQADVLFGVLSHFSPRHPVDLCGASWGALVAAACAARHPGAVRKLMLGSFQVHTNSALRRVAAEAVGLLAFGGGSAIAELFIEEFGAGLPEAFRQAMRTQFDRLTMAQMHQMEEQCSTLAAGADLREVVDVHRIGGDILILNGADDPLVDAWDTTTADCFPRAERHVLRGVGHFLHLERPSIVDVYLEFAQRRSVGAVAGDLTRLSA